MKEEEESAKDVGEHVMQEVYKTDARHVMNDGAHEIHGMQEGDEM